jgi:glycosyltransferase involved in cell wall biosynthesis
LKNRILFVSYHFWPPFFGGELRHSIERFQGLAARGFEVTVLTSGFPGFPTFQGDQGLKIFRSPVVGQSRLARLFRRLVYFFWVCWKMMDMQFDVYHQGDAAGIDFVTSACEIWLWTRVARWKHAKNVIVHSLADTEQEAFSSRGWNGFWRRALFSNFDKIVAVSPGLYTGLCTAFPEKVYQILYGVRDDIFRPLDQASREGIRSENGLSAGNVVFSFLGTVGNRKGFDLLALAFANLVGEYPEWRLWVLGPYTLEHSQNIDLRDVSRVTRSLEPISSKVKYWGRVDEREQLSHLLASSDVFVFPSRREGMPIAPMEAMAAGLPVILSSIPGVTDLASLEGETGYYIPVNDAEALRSAMERLGRDMVLRKKMGHSAVLRVHESFGWKDHLDRWEELYCRLKPSGRPVSPGTRWVQ